MYLIALILALVPILGCGVVNPYRKNSEGYYTEHYYACGPTALEKAINAAYVKRGIERVCAPNKGISQQIQSGGMIRKELLAFFSKSSIQITWPSEIKKIVNLHGFDVVTVDSLDSLDPQKDIAIVLIHGKFFSGQYHWVVYPLDNVKNFYGEKTVIDAVYLLKWKGD